VDDSVWGVSESFPGYLVRLQRGNNAPESCKAQIFKVPEPGFDPRGVDIDSNGVVWTALAASSHLASFDFRKCKDLNGPAKNDGSQCKEGWTLYQTNGPKLRGTDIPADFHYFNWVDQQNTLGMGANKPIANGSNSDSLLVLDPATRQWTTLRVPYPLGFYSRGLDGRIDDAGAGWKGRGLWANYGTHFVWHIEGGKGTKGKLVHFQMSNYLGAGEKLPEAKRLLAHRYELRTKRLRELPQWEIYSIFLDSFATALDPHSNYLSPEAVEDFRISMSLSLEGIGVALSERDGYSVVERIIPGGAADRIEHGLEPNDKIIAVAEDGGESVNIVDMPLREAVSLIRGKKGTKVHLTVLRQGDETQRFPLAIVRDKIDLAEQAASLRFESRERNGKPF